MASLRHMLGRTNSPTENMSRKKKDHGNTAQKLSKGMDGVGDDEASVFVGTVDGRTVTTGESNETDMSSGERRRRAAGASKLTILLPCETVVLILYFQLELPLRKIARNFLLEFSKGVVLQSATSRGETRDIFVRVTDKYFAWSFTDQPKQVVTPLHEIGRVQAGLPLHMVGKYSEDVNKRAFHLILKGKPVAASFLAASEKARDSILTGFHAVLELC